MEVIHDSGWLVINQADAKTAEINITGVIGGSFMSDSNDSANTSDKMRAELKAIADIQAEKIIVNIDSPGGSVAHGFSIHDLLAQHPAQKETRIIGMTASIATVIAQAGDVRKISDNALFLIHRASTVAMGNVESMKSAINDLETVDKKIVSIYTKRSGKDEQSFLDLMAANGGKGKWIDGKDAQSFGLVDHVMEPSKMAALYDKELFNSLNYPNIEMEDKSLIDSIKSTIKAAFADEQKPDYSGFEAKIKELEEEISAHMNVIGENAQTIADKDERIEALEKVLSERDEEISNLSSEMNKMKAVSTEIKGPQAKEGDEGVQKEDEFADILNYMKGETSVIRPDNDREIYQD